MEQRGDWQFLIVEDEKWVWAATCPDGTEKRAPVPFDTLRDCAEDAKKHGWAAWTADERRHIETLRDPLDSVRD